MAVSSIIIDPTGASLRSPDNAQQFAPGHVAHGDYGGKYLYGQSNANLAVNSVVYFDKDYIANPVTTAFSPFGAKVGVAKTAMSTGQWGFFQVGGQVPVRVATAVPVNTRLNSTTNGGVVDDDGTTGAKVINGMVLGVAAGGNGSFEATLTEPTIGATL